MLTKSHIEPFKFTIDNIKKILNTSCIEKEQEQIKRTLQPITQISNLKQFLVILLDFHWYNKLSLIFQKMNEIIQQISLDQKNQENQKDFPGSPSKNLQENRQILLKGIKKIDLTPSTKKSRGINESGITHLLEELVQILQKFDQIKQISKPIKLLISEIYDDLNIQESQNSQANENIDLQQILKLLLDITSEQQSKKWQSFRLKQENTQKFKELLQHIHIIYKFMQVIRTNTHDIFNLIQHKSQHQIDNESKSSQILEHNTKKSNVQSQNRSLLTEMLKDSSQRSNLEIQQNQFTTQIVLKPRFRQYSQKEDMAFLDQHYRMSTTKSAKPYSKTPIMIRSQMNYGQDKENFIIKKRQVKAKKSQMGCSQCEIF